MTEAITMPPGYQMTTKAKGVPWEAFIAIGWTVEQMISEGNIEPVSASPLDLARERLHKAEMHLQYSKRGENGYLSMEDAQAEVDQAIRDVAALGGVKTYDPVRAAKIEAAEAREREIEIAAAQEELPGAKVQVELAQKELNNAEKSGDQEKTHQARNWLKDSQRNLEQLQKVLGDRANEFLCTDKYVTAADMNKLFLGYTYVNDIHRIVGPSGFLYNEQKFDAHPRFAKHGYAMDFACQEIRESGWKAFIQSEVSKGEKVDGIVFDPREKPGAILVREQQRLINTWRPVQIRMKKGDVEPFINHLKILFPHDWRILHNYLKFMMQHKGEKVMWWPFIQGVPGNGKTFISATMTYCIGRKFTQAPIPKNMDSNFNASLYGCIFLSIDDIPGDDSFDTIWHTLKPMVTGVTLEIEPKGVDKVTREVCFNGLMTANYKDAVKKDVDDRRIATFFSAQQHRPDLVRDGLTKEHFDKLWAWAQADGWAYVAHHLMTEPIDDGFNRTDCPITSATEEHIRISRPPAQQVLLKAVRALAPGFRNGWVNMDAFHLELVRLPKTRNLTPNAEAKIASDLNYMPHPGLPEGQLTVALPDGSRPVLYVVADHTTRHITDPKTIAAMYCEAQK